MVLEPAKNFNVAIDYFKIERKDEINYRDLRTCWRAKTSRSTAS